MHSSSTKFVDHVENQSTESYSCGIFLCLCAMRAFATIAAMFSCDGKLISGKVCVAQGFEVVPSNMVLNEAHLLRNFRCLVSVALL